MRFAQLPPLLGTTIFLNYLLWIQTQRFSQLSAFRKNLLPLNPAFRKQKHWTYRQMILQLQTKPATQPPSLQVTHQSNLPPMDPYTKVSSTAIPQEEPKTVAPQYSLVPLIASPSLPMAPPDLPALTTNAPSQ